MANKSRFEELIIKFLLRVAPHLEKAEREELAADLEAVVGPFLKKGRKKSVDAE